MRSYSRTEVVAILSIEESFLVELERESIIAPDAEPARYSPRMLERARVARTLVTELDVNLAGAAIIVRMREEMAGLRRRAELLAKVLDESGGRLP